MALADLEQMKEIAAKIRTTLGDLHQVYRGNVVTKGRDFQPIASQRAVADVIDILETAADTLDEALTRAEGEGTFEGVPPGG